MTTERAIGDHLAARRKMPRHLPTFLLGHSIGGLVTISSALRDRQNLSGVILLAPGLLYDANGLVRLVARIGGVLMTGLSGPLREGSLDSLTRDSKARQEIQHDPLMYLGQVMWLTLAGGANISHANWKLSPPHSGRKARSAGRPGSRKDPAGHGAVAV